MSIVKLAAEKQKSWVQRHPLLTGGIALTGGLAAADAGLNLYKHFGKFKTLAGSMPTVKKGLKEGAIYGGILSSVEPAISHGIMGQREQNK